MKRSHFFIAILTIIALPVLTKAQTFVNPDTTQQAGDIYLRDSDVYYAPFAPPASYDVRDSLCEIADMLMDPDGVGTGYYTPWTHHVPLYDWAPCGDTIGPDQVWQRFFTAKRDSLGHPHDLIAGGGAPGTRVTVSANEDVDFRASGRIILKSGFHVKPGAFFHAYTEPRWGDSVFSDDFDSTKLDRSKWYVGKGTGELLGLGAECLSDSNVRDTLDPDAHDGHALDIIIREETPYCSCSNWPYDITDTCHGAPYPADTNIYKFAFSTANIRSCPFQFSQNAIPNFPPAYSHAPYGKYEFREKLPHTMFHTNNWSTSLDELDLNETDNGEMGLLHPGLGLTLQYGPFKGIFSRHVNGPGDTTVQFRCGAANWSTVNNPVTLFIGGFAYEVQLVTTPTDTLDTARSRTSDAGGWPYSLAYSVDTMTFFYGRSTSNTTDPFTWNVSTDGGGNWRLFSAPYRVIGTDSSWLSKSYQPTSIILTIDHFGTKDTINCHWDHISGKIWLDNPLSPTADLHTNTEAYSYTVNEQYSGYRIPGYVIDHFLSENKNQHLDTAGFSTSPYQYHTFSFEVLPHEIRYLCDGNVERRIPDRLIPRNSPFYDWASKFPQYPIVLQPGEVDIDQSGNDPDPLGTDTTTQSDWPFYKSATYAERHYFETHTTNPGFWNVNGKPAAHELIDYVKVWDVPADMKIPSYPH